MSGKIEDTTKDTVLAYSNNRIYTLLIPSIVKRHLIRKYRDTQRMRIRLYIKIFSIGLFYLLKKVAKSADLIIIDTEYVGYEKDIRSMLLNYIRNSYPDFNKKRIVFQQIGKDSKAHEIAVRTLRDEIKEDQAITEKQIEEFM